VAHEVGAVRVDVEFLASHGEDVENVLLAQFGEVGRRHRAADYDDHRREPYQPLTL